MFTPALLKGETWGFPGQPVEQVETHAAHVFLVGDRAFKIKKDVRLPYLDFSTVEKRRAALAAELEINRLFTPDLYLGLEEVHGEPVLVMRRFPPARFSPGRRPMVELQPVWPRNSRPWWRSPTPMRRVAMFAGQRS